MKILRYFQVRYYRYSNLVYLEVLPSIDSID